MRRLPYLRLKQSKLRPVGSTFDSNVAFHRGTQRQFLENIGLEDDLRSRIFGTFVVKFIACLPVSPRIFEHLRNGIIARL